MTLATQLALASDLVRTDIIMVPLFPYLAIRYHVDDVPTTMVNGVKTLVGAHEETQAVRTMLAGCKRI